MRVSARAARPPPSGRYSWSWRKRSRTACAGAGREFDLVEEDRAAARLLDEADAAAVGAGEGAALVAEQFADHELLRQRGAVDRHERVAAARRAVVQRARDQFLARAGLALDQDRGVAGAEARDLGHDLQKGEAAADQPAIDGNVRVKAGHHRHGIPSRLLYDRPR